MDNSVRRIGVLAPPANVALEREFPRYLPEGVVMSHNRLSRPGSAISGESLRAMADSVERAAHDLALAYPEVILYGCTSGSFLMGIGKEEEIARKITAHTGIPAFTTSTAVVEALRAVSARSVFMITPYPQDLNEHEIAFLKHYGFRVVGLDSFLCPVSKDIRAISSEQVAAMALAHRQEIASADALFISCTNLLTMDKIAELETALGRAVVSSNQASLWSALQRLGVHEVRHPAGQLFGFACQVETPR